MTKDEALKLALEALGWTDEWRPQGLKEEAITAVREALAEQPAQRTWVGLTDDEVDIAWRSVDYTVPYSQFRIDIAKAIEAKLKEKNT